MPSGDGTQHGREEQYRSDGGVDLHHGTGQTFQCLQQVCCRLLLYIVCVRMSIGEGSG